MYILDFAKLESEICCATKANIQRGATDVHNEQLKPRSRPSICPIEVRL